MRHAKHVYTSFGVDVVQMDNDIDGFFLARSRSIAAGPRRTASFIYSCLLSSDSVRFARLICFYYFVDVSCSDLPYLSTEWFVFAWLLSRMLFSTFAVISCLSTSNACRQHQIRLFHSGVWVRFLCAAISLSLDTKDTEHSSQRIRRNNVTIKCNNAGTAKTPPKMKNVTNLKWLSADAVEASAKRNLDIMF